MHTTLKPRKTNVSPFETAAMAALTIGGNDAVLTMNSRAEQLFGYRARDVIGWDISMLICEPDPTEDGGRSRSWWHEDEDIPLSGSYPVTAKRKDGSCFSAVLTLTRIHVNGEATLVAIVRKRT
jgi:two-component system, LuxR family, sensor kinase FixL